MVETKLVKAHCTKTNQYFGLEVKQFGGIWKVVNMINLSNDEARVVVSEVKQATFETNKNLIPCLKCGNRKIGGCSCAKKKHQCSPDMKYHFDCAYCDELKVDYSLPKRSDISNIDGETVTLSQGKEVKVVTFSNVEWEKFDNIQEHPSGAEFGEPKIHVDANEENIEFHGYNISAMDEGVFYMIGKEDDFEIECDVDTTTIKPHPGGHFYVSFGIISAKITQDGGKFYLDEKEIASVGAKFNMRLSLTECGLYEVYINGKKQGSKNSPVKKDIKIVFGFAHDSHYCELLSHAYIKGIKMKQGVSQQSAGDNQNKRGFRRFW